MPAPVPCIDVTGADSTHLLTNNNSISKPFNSNHWFTDDDICSVLQAIVPKPAFDFINPVYSLCIVQNIPINFSLKSHHHEAQILFVPVNIRMCHWILMIYNNVSQQDTWIDPYFNNTFHADSLKSCRAIHNFLKSLFGTNHQFITRSIEHVRRQTNNDDCGPLVCYYVLQTIRNQSLNDSKCKIMDIRHLAFQLESNHNSEKLTNLLVGGGGIGHSADKIASMMRIFFREIPNVHIMTAITAKHIADDDIEFIIDHIRFKTFRDVLYVATVINAESRFLLYVYQRQEGNSFLFNIDSSIETDLTEAQKSIGSRITSYLNKFLLNGQAMMKDRSLPVLATKNIDPAKKAILACSTLFQNNIRKLPKLDNHSISNVCNTVMKTSRNFSRIINSRMTHLSIVDFFATLNLDQTFMIMDSIMCTALFDEHWQYIQTYLDVIQLRNTRTLFCLVQPQQYHLCLLVLQLDCWEYFIFNPTANIIDENLRIYCTAVVDRIIEFACLGKPIFVANSCPHLTFGSGFFSNLLICGYIERFAEDAPLTDIDIDEMAAKFDFHLSPEPFLEPAKTKPSKTTVKKASLKDRTAKSQAIFHQCQLQNANDIYQTLLNNLPIQLLPGRKTYKPYLGRKKPFQLPNKVQLQEDFKTKMKPTVERIISQPNDVSTLPSVDLILKTFEVPSVESDEWPLLQFCQRAQQTLVLEPFSYKEVQKKLSTINDSSPGPDKVNYSHLRDIDPECKLLTHLFNKIITDGQSPDSWRCFKTTLIPKPNKSSYDEMSSWRPIAVANSSYKLFTSILSDRLYKWVCEQKILHPGQKGGTEYEGCIDHNAVLNAIFERANSRSHNQRNVSIAWLDIRNAFGSVPHQYLWQCLHAIGVGDDFVGVLKELYQNTVTFFKCGTIVTPEIPVNVGVKQGCPISMLLFAIAINPLLMAIDRCNVDKYDLFGHKIQILAYADDLAIVANNERDLQTLLNTAVHTGRQCNLLFEPKKCAFIHLPATNGNISPITINSQDIMSLASGQFYEYLGVPVGNKIDQTPHKLLDEVCGNIEKINASGLMKHQKLKAIKTFIFPKITFAFRTREIKTSHLYENIHGKRNPTSRIREAFRDILNIPSNAEVSYMYVSTKNGGIGLWDLLDEYYLQTLVQMFKLLNSKDPMISDVAQKTLVEAAKVRFREEGISLDQALEWLTCRREPEGTHNANKTWWIRGRRAIKHFKENLNTHIFLKRSANGIIMNIIDARNISVDIEPSALKEVTMHLHELVHCTYLIKWTVSGKSALTCQTHSHNASLNKIILSGQIGTFAWDFIHKAKINCLPVNANKYNVEEYRKKCRRCHKCEESMLHVLQKCEANLSIITMRHDACLDIIYQHIKSPRLLISVDETVTCVSDIAEVCRQRVDLYIEDKDNKRVYLVDIKCPMDFQDTMALAAQNNQTKYARLKQHISHAKPAFNVSLDTIVIGALGSVPENSQQVMTKIGIPERALKRIVAELAITSIRHSARIFHFHCTGVLVNFGRNSVLADPHILDGRLQCLVNKESSDPIVDAEWNPRP